MKKTIVALLIMVAFTTGAFAQGVEINVDNFNNTNMSPFARSSGFLFNEDRALLTNDVSVTLLGGSTSSNLVPIVTLLNSAGQILSGNTVGSPGQFLDASGNAYNIPGVAPGGTAFLDLQVWEGNFSNFNAADATVNVPTGESGVFTNPTGGDSANPLPEDLVGMPSILVIAKPEPSTLALFGLGAVSLLLFHRRKK